MSKSMHESWEDLDAAVDDLKAALWAERWYFITVLGIAWLGLALWAFALYA